MKNKKSLLIILGIFSLLSLRAMPILNNFPEQFELSNIPPGMTEILLQGTLCVNTGPNSVEAYLSKNSVQICFHQNFGYVNITLLNETGSVVYNNTVNTAVQQTFYIPLSGTSSGNYTLVLDNANGYAEGEFAR